MGTWDIGPFENDMAADFAHTLDETAQDERESVVRATLTRTIQTRVYLESPRRGRNRCRRRSHRGTVPSSEPTAQATGSTKPSQAQHRCVWARRSLTRSF
jgi:Domain of unknown function (DUF4259)